MKVRMCTSLAAFLLIAACARGEDARPIENTTVDGNASDLALLDDVDSDANAGHRNPVTDAWIGKWIGVDGTTLNIQPSGDMGDYIITTVLLGGTASYNGTADGDVIRFVRNGRPESVRAVTGAATGLKWLADKQNCLMIQQGEGFCRDEAAPPAEAQP